MTLYNTTRFTQDLLKTHESSPPSFTVRLYREHWTLNNGIKFMYNHQTAVSGALSHLRPSLKAHLIIVSTR